MISSKQLREAGALLRAGRLVAFPTETVYGLGANALDAEAVARIFEVKGRPSTSPLIVHVDSIEMARGLASEWPGAATTLAAAYWPGPLTLVLRKAPHIPDIVTAGLPTVGLRLPAHPIALALIREAGVPLAAPSANRFTELSPTLAAHVRSSLGGQVDLIIDGGPASIGIESTVLSLAGSEPVLLRPGIVSREEIEARIGPVMEDTEAGAGAHSSPGLHRRHYRPKTPLVLVENCRLPDHGRGAYLHFAPCPQPPSDHVEMVTMPLNPTDYAARLYAELHRLDGLGLDWIAVEKLSEEPAWRGIADRLNRAKQIG
ncbi:MAG: L-threonylcarbamoyladenylate synthase [Bryobacteraceae bacterium]